MNVTVLPKDWSLLPLGDVAHVYAGGTPSRAVASYWGGEIPWVTTAEVDAVYITSSRERITTEALSFSAAKIAQPGTLLLAMYGQGKTRGKVAMLRIPSAMNQACAAIEVGTRVDASYLLYYLSSQYDAIRGMSNSGSQDNLSGSIVKGIPVAVPPIPEQRAIAAALDDVTELTKELEGLIAKKRDIKQGMMQELLTGKTRLPDSSGAWTTLHVAAASHLKARIGWQGLTTEEYRESGEYRLVGGTEFRDGRVDWDRTPYVDKWRFDQDPNIQLQVGDVLITKDGTIGKVAIVESLPGPATLNSGVFVVRPKRGAYDSGFLYWMLRSRIFEDFVAGLSAGSTINHLYQRDLVTLEFSVPAALDEQRAIAVALTVADSESAALERRLESARAIKVGMMQELLTGRTRLPVGAAL